MSKKFTVYADGRVAEPFTPLKAEDGKRLAVWFYAGRGVFEFVVQSSKPDVTGITYGSVWNSPVQFKISTRMLRRALELVDSGRTGKARREQARGR